MSPIYEFENEAGEHRDEFFRMEDRPQVGAWVEIDGAPWRRIVEAPQLASSKGQENYRLHSEACPNLSSIEYHERRARYLQEKGHPVRMPVRAPAYDEVGRAVFKSEKELRDYCAKDGRFNVGNPGEIAHQHVAAVTGHKKKQLAEMKTRDKLAALPEVK